MEYALRRPILPGSALLNAARRFIGRHRFIQIWDGTRAVRSAADFFYHALRDIGLDPNIGTDNTSHPYTWRV